MILAGDHDDFKRKTLGFRLKTCWNDGAEPLTTKFTVYYIYIGSMLPVFVYQKNKSKLMSQYQIICPFHITKTRMKSRGDN